MTNTAELSQTISKDWHDGILDLESIKIEPELKQVSFLISIYDPTPGRIIVKTCLFASGYVTMLERQVVFAGVDDVAVHANGHPELYVVEASAVPQGLELSAANGKLTLIGSDISLIDDQLIQTWERRRVEWLGFFQSEWGGKPNE